MTDPVRIIVADVLAGLAQLADKSVHCCVTSPPYWGLRQYLKDGAVVLRRDLSPDQQAAVLAELSRLGVKPCY